MSSNTSKYFDAYNRKLLDGFDRLTAFSDAHDTALEDGCNFDKQTSACNTEPDISYVDFLKGLLSPGGDLASIMPAPASDLLKGISSGKITLKDVNSSLRKLISFYDPIENKALIDIYFWRNTLPASKPNARAAAFDQVARIAGLKFNQGGWNESDDDDESPAVGYNDSLPARNRLLMLAKMVGIPERSCCSPSDKPMEWMLSACDTILKNGIDAQQQAEIDKAQDQISKGAQKIDQRKWANAMVRKGSMDNNQSSPLAKGLIMGVAAFGLIYAYKSLNKTKKS